jgi:hypothetical protein
LLTPCNFLYSFLTVFRGIILVLPVPVEHGLCIAVPLSGFAAFSEDRTQGQDFTDGLYFPSSLLPPPVQLHIFLLSIIVWVLNVLSNAHVLKT